MGKVALGDLDRRLEALAAERTVTLGETTHDDEISKPLDKTGWIDTPQGKRELRRISYLLRLRCLALEPLERLLMDGKSFDRTLF